MYTSTVLPCGQLSNTSCSGFDSVSVLLGRVGIQFPCGFSFAFCFSFPPSSPPFPGATNRGCSFASRLNSSIASMSAAMAFEVSYLCWLGIRCCLMPCGAIWFEFFAFLDLFRHLFTRFALVLVCIFLPLSQMVGSLDVKCGSSNWLARLIGFRSTELCLRSTLPSSTDLTQTAAFLFTD